MNGNVLLETKELRKDFGSNQVLRGISTQICQGEVVAIIGPSGSGKSTLLHVLGGVDIPTSGKVYMEGTDVYAQNESQLAIFRRRQVGLIYQFYNLIPVLNVTENMTLPVLMDGRPVNEERLHELLDILSLKGREGHLPNQLSGGQMQRVAIARALVNDPDILLADEPTGALDSETSVQVMELLKRVAEKRLVVMVTHNGELAQRYSTRIVRLRDGKIVDDSNPCPQEEAAAQPEARSLGRARMSFGTSLSLSFNNLRTKKGRTLLTAFAGSIGIIGIALILALSSGVNGYIDGIQRSTMSSYPITISTQTVDMSGVMGTRGGMRGGQDSSPIERGPGIYAGYGDLERSEAMAGNIKENDLTAFKRYLDDPDSEIRPYLGENGVVYGYDVRFGGEPVLPLRPH